MNYAMVTTEKKSKFQILTFHFLTMPQRQTFY